MAAKSCQARQHIGEVADGPQRPAIVKIAAADLPAAAVCLAPTEPLKVFP